MKDSVYQDEYGMVRPSRDPNWERWAFMPNQGQTVWFASRLEAVGAALQHRAKCEANNAHKKPLTLKVGAI